MPTILGVTALFLLATEALQWDLTITTGLSAKNLVIYLLATLLILRMVVARSSVMVAVQMHSAFIVLFLYAVVSWLVAGLVIQYPSYDLVEGGIKLKSHLLDWFIFFAVFLFGTSTAEECLKVIKYLLIGVVFANALTVLDAVGVIDLGFRVREDGRAGGAMGESNQFAAFLILFLPAIIASAVSARGVRRLFWLGGAFVSGAALVMTASRGGFVGLMLACAVGGYLYRRHISYTRASGWVLGALIVFVLTMSMSQYGALLTERVIGQTASLDVTEASSGRSEIWATLLLAMFAEPITFITGFGWNVYWSMPFQFSPHNHYLSLWFNLGLVGLGCGTYLLFSAIGRARRASFEAKPPLRGQLIAFVIGATGVCGAVFFVELHQAWLYFWMYAGVAMRLAACVEPATATAPVRQGAAPQPVTRDPHGWVVAPRRRLT